MHERTVSCTLEIFFNVKDIAASCKDEFGSDDLYDDFSLLDFAYRILEAWSQEYLRIPGGFEMLG